MRKITVAACQFSMSVESDENHQIAYRLIRDAASRGANVILLPELFSTPYFCKVMNEKYFALAGEVDKHPMLSSMSALARELNVVLPVSFFEKAGSRYFNSLMMIDADGKQLGVYRKSHIPEGPGYNEKFYFSKGDTGYQVFETAFGVLGCGICWDQWFPEAARSMVLQGAEILLYPTAIGSEPMHPAYDSQPHWQRVMQGHSAANMVPVVAANRVGVERDGDVELTFYGSSFITDETGLKLTEANRSEEAILIHQLDLDYLSQQRAWWGLFRDNLSGFAV